MLRLVNHASGHGVETVIVDGRVRMEDRVVLGVDEAAILAGAETYERTGLDDPNPKHPDTWHRVRYGAVG